MKFPFWSREKREHEWKIVYVGTDLLRYFDDELRPPTGIAGDVSIGKGCIMRVCENCGKREVLRNIDFEDGPGAFSKEYED